VKKLFFIVLCLLIARIAMADIVYLTDGTILTGKISEKHADYIIIETEDETLEIQKEDIDHFNYGKKKSKRSEASDLFKFTLWGGYANFKMDDVNNNINLDAREGRDLGIDISADQVKNGYVVGLDIGLKINPSVYIGPRIEYLIPDNGRIIAGSYNNAATQTFKYSLLAIMAGGSYTCELSNELSLIGKLYIGYGLANTDYMYEAWGYDMGYKGDGSGMVTDISFGVEYPIARQSKIGLDLGYRLAKISKMTYSEDNWFWGSKEGDTIKGFYNNDLSVDFSGLFLNIGMNLFF
jgi:hypothetical protein